MKSVHPKKRREPIKTLVVNGKEHKFYQIEQADEMLHSRYIVAEIQELYIRAGISEGFLKEVAQMLIDTAMESKDMKKLKEDVVAVGQNLKARLGMIAEKRMYEELACVYFLMDDEPLEYDEEYQREKKAVWRSAGEQDFFILQAFNKTMPSANTLTSDILAVWQALDERLKQLQMLTD